MKASALTLTTPDGDALTELATAATSARVRTTIVGASTLVVRLPEAMLSAALTTARTAHAAGRAWSFVGVKRQGDLVALTYEDATIAALRTKRDRVLYRVALTAADIIGRFCAEAGVPVDVEPTLGETHVEGAGRSILTATDSWREIGALADRLGGRAFSDGARLIVTRDPVLLAADAPRVTSARGPVLGDIDFAIDVAQPYERAELTAASTWAVEAGGVVDLYGVGPADGRWIVETWTRDIPTTTAGRVRLTRPTTIGA